MFAKAGNGSQGQRVQSTFSSSRFTGLPFANFNLALGTVTATGGGATASIQSMGNGWYRCITTAVCNSSGNGGGFFAGLITTDNAVREESFLGIDTHFIYAWGAQLETGSVATSYIPTTAGTGSRSADVISVTGAVSGSIGQTEGTIYLEVEALNASQQVFAIGTGGTNSIHIYKISNSQYRASINGQSGGGNIDLTDSIARTGFVKLAIAYKSGDSALVANGSTPVTSATSLTFGALTSVNFFGTYQAALPFRVRAVALYNTRLTDAELALITQP